MNEIYIDCEFNGFGGELLSFAMVADDGREFYSVLPQPSSYDEWVRENVVPILGKSPVASYGDFRLAFLEFLRGFRNPTIIADWAADLYYFNQVLLGAEYTESVMPPCTMKLIACDYDSAIPHNALEDARAIRVALSTVSPLSERDGWQPIADAKKDGSIIWAKLRDDIYPTILPTRADLSRWNGLQIPLRHPGLADDGFDVGWNVAAPVGNGGFPDEWIEGWRLLPAPPREVK